MPNPPEARVDAEALQRWIMDPCTRHSERETQAEYVRALAIERDEALEVLGEMVTLYIDADWDAVPNVATLEVRARALLSKHRASGEVAG
jgi:hypothetical protein